MRDPNRIDGLLARLGEIWKQNPDLRLGQLLWAAGDDDPRHIECEELVAALEAWEAKRFREWLVALRLRMPAETVAEIAASVGRSTSTLSKLWADHGITVEYPAISQRRWTLPYARRLHARWVKGETLADLEASEGIHRATIWHAFNRLGLKLPDHVTRQGRGKMSAARKAAEKSVMYAAANCDQGRSWWTIHAECVEKFGYPYTMPALQAATRRFQKRAKGWNQIRKGRAVEAEQ